uniref:Sialate O-acetylesterase n=1 Tax=Roseihalotalea indica TaxID=2867963 RepID=A0AA49JBR1_9BACT|nr:sialate O-acetylesterase [Tunicatimonas sp. TK19036]
MRIVLVLLSMTVLVACQRKGYTERQNFPNDMQVVENLPGPNNVWVFLLAGQSNMAGRGEVAPVDTIPHERIFSINPDGEIVYAKEPLHYYEPNLTGLDCGLSFGKTLIDHLPDSVSLLLLPTAVGGSAIQQWLGDSTHRQVRLLSNFREKVAIGQRYGRIKGVLWHQGENDATEEGIPHYQQRLTELIAIFRDLAQNEELPVVLGELGSYSRNPENWLRLNQEIHAYANQNPQAAVVYTQDLPGKDDYLHFTAEGQRELGKRFAQEYLKLMQIP